MQRGWRRKHPRVAYRFPVECIALARGTMRRLTVGSAGRLVGRASRASLVLVSAAVIAIMVASIVSGPTGDRVLAQGRDDHLTTYGLSAVLFGSDERSDASAAVADPVDASARQTRGWRRSDAYTPTRRQPVAVHWRAPEAGGRMRGEPKTRSAADATSGLAGHRAVCVRLCDGYFFPMGDIAGRSDVESRASLCTGLCPGAPTRLFVSPGTSDDMSRATAAGTGQRYASLPVAFAHTREVGPTCACHPAGEPDGATMSPLVDFTMRSGDTVMTAAGWRVFQGADHWPYRRDDFRTLQTARNLPPRTRSILASIEDASLGRPVAGRLRPLLVTPRLRVAAALDDAPAPNGAAARRDAGGLRAP